MTKRTASIAIFLFGAAILPGCSFSVGEENFLRPVSAGRLDQGQIQHTPYASTVHTITAADGTKLYATYLKQPGATMTILYFGGNGFTIGKIGAVTAAHFAPLGVNLMLVDHRGYGQSGGTPQLQAMMTDGLSAFDHLALLPGENASRIVVHGHSLGSFVAGYVAAHRVTAGAVLESSVTTTEDWIKARKGMLPVRIKLSAQLQGQGNLRNVKAIEEPLLILVGAKDKVTPPRLSKSLFAASPLPAGIKSLHIVKNATHTDVIGQPATVPLYRKFLANRLVDLSKE